MDLVKKIALFFFLFHQLALSQIIFTEVMFDVKGSDYHDEFIELFNVSYTDTIDLSGWQFSDSSGVDRLSDAGYGLRIQPRQYTVILDLSYFTHSSTYDDVIPDTALILTISDNSFGSGGLSNTHGERLSLIDAGGDTVQVYRYSTDNKPGISDEKIILSADNSAANWSNSLIEGGTPGRRNSVTPYDYDLGFKKASLQYHPQNDVETGRFLFINFTFQNRGLKTFSNAVHVKLFAETFHDSLFQNVEDMIMDSVLSVTLDSAQGLSIQDRWKPESAGSYWLTAVLQSSRDRNPLNNILSANVNVFDSRRTVILNEIKFLTEENEPEWIELLNTGNAPLSLQHWAVTDRKDTAFVDSFACIYPGQFKILCARKSLKDFYPLPDSLLIRLKQWPVLNNDEDTVFLLNPAGGWVEQVPYRLAWLEGEQWRNPSLERINPHIDSRLSENWGPSTSVENATPGKVNSIFTEIVSKVTKISIKPNPFSPDGDGHEDYTVIQAEFPVTSGRVRAEIYDVMGRKVKRLADARFTGSRWQMVWNGRNDHLHIVRMGIYILFIQVLNDRHGIIKEYKEMIVVAKRL